MNKIYIAEFGLRISEFMIQNRKSFFGLFIPHSALCNPHSGFLK